MESVIEEVACFKYVSLYSNILAFKIKYLNCWEWEGRRNRYWWVMKARKRHSPVKFNSKGIFIYDNVAVQHGSRMRDFHVHCWELGLSVSGNSVPSCDLSHNSLFSWEHRLITINNLTLLTTSNKWISSLSSTLGFPNGFPEVHHF